MPKLTPINLERKRGNFFAMAFIYTTNGTRLLTGDVHSIDSYCGEHFGICHGMLVVPGRDLWFNKPTKPIKRWRLFGNKVGSDTWLTHFSMDQLNDSYGTAAYWRQQGIKRPCWVLYKQGGTVIRTWRRLPKKYINWEKLIDSAGS